MPVFLRLHRITSAGGIMPGEEFHMQYMCCDNRPTYRRVGMNTLKFDRKSNSVVSNLEVMIVFGRHFGLLNFRADWERVT